MPLDVKRNSFGIWQITGTVAGIRVRRSARTRDHKSALAEAQRIERELWQDRASEAVSFEQAALSYLQADGERRFVTPLLHHFKGADVRGILSGNVEDAARALYPTAAPATWNRQVVVPVSAILNHAAARGWRPPFRMKRFKEEAAPRQASDAAWVEAFMGAAPENLANLALFMWTTGARISEALTFDPATIEDRKGWLLSKSGWRPIYLSREVMLRLAGKRVPVFGYRSRHSVYKAWKAACVKAEIAYLPPHQAGRHGFATEMIVRRGIDAATAAKLGGWKSPRLLVEKYAHPERLTEIVDEVFDAPTVKPVTNPLPRKSSKSRKSGGESG